MPVELWNNYAITTLSGNGGSITSGATSLLVASSASFPAPTSGQQFRILIESELLIVTAVASLTWTVIRGAEGTTAASHNDGMGVTCEFTAAQLRTFQQIPTIDLTAACRNFLP